ncbi:MAG: TlyA family RNA methyltransferase [Candidatus Sericytochromatia bacterium]
MKKRIDILLVEKNFFDSRQKAQTAIMSGIVKVNEKVVDKVGTLIKETDIITFKEALEEKYVSRGGFKLEKAINIFNPKLENKIFLDVGASTGGFTDCLLQNKAKLVYAIDVGYGQLDWKIRSNPNVKVLERINARHLKQEELYKENEEKADACVMDVSFISITKIIPNLIELLKEDFFIIALIKPQFEAGKENLKKGVVTSSDIHIKVIEDVNNFLNSLSLYINQLTFSPIKGPSGNIEFLAFISKNSENIIDNQLIKQIVLDSKNQLD